jgi:antitoxin component of MazEF toxin-antitoxin module
MKFVLHKTKKDCTIPASALAVAGLKRDGELRLEVDSGVIVVLRPQMTAKKLLSVSEFLSMLASDMIAAVAVECGECSCCGDCEESCECDYCGSRDKCRGIEIPDCLLERAGIGADQPWKADVEDGAVTIRAIPEAEADCDSRFPDDVPEIARAAFIEADVCVNRLREILCGNQSIPF